MGSVWVVSSFLFEVNQNSFKMLEIDIYGLLPLEHEEQLEVSSISLEM